MSGVESDLRRGKGWGLGRYNARSLEAARRRARGDAGGRWETEMYGRGRGNLAGEEAESASTGARRC